MSSSNDADDAGREGRGSTKILNVWHPGYFSFTALRRVPVLTHTILLMDLQTRTSELRFHVAKVAF